MKPALRLVALAVVALGLVAAVLVFSLSRTPSTPASAAAGPSTGAWAEGPASPRLVVWPTRSKYHMFAELHGTLGVNDEGCISFGDDVVLADHGTRVTPDGKSVVFPGNLVLPLGVGFVGGGGGYGDRRWLEQTARRNWDDDLVDALERCLGDGPGGVVQVWMSADDFR